MPDERPNPYSPTSPGAGWLPDVSGPDGVRVTIRVEPAVDRLRRWFNLLHAPAPLTPAGVARLEYQSLPGLFQRLVLRDRWVVDIESDSGERQRVSADGRSDAIEQARRIHAGIQKQGVAFLRTPTTP